MKAQVLLLSPSVICHVGAAIRFYFDFNKDTQLLIDMSYLFIHKLIEKNIQQNNNWKIIYLRH
jgi:hypothetical protein